MYLYLDTSEDLTLAIINSDYKLIELSEIETKKTSLILQSSIDELMHKHKVTFSNLEGIIFCAGPGSYTGMRVGQGFVDICRWQGIKTYSFYHFQIPKILKIAKGHWISTAFKGEDFIFSWDQQSENQSLIRSSESLSLVSGELYSRHSTFNEQSSISTQELLKIHTKEIIEYVVEKNFQKPLFYYRPLEAEFKVPNA